MIRTHLILIIECTLLLLLYSCSGQKGERSVNEIEETLTIAIPDTSMRGTLRAISPTTLTISPEGSEANADFYYDEARGRHQIFGSLTEGHRYALVVDADEQAVLMMVNLTELSGQWFYDTTEGRGFILTTAGALSSINTEDFSFKKWKFYNGRIVLFYVGIEDVVDDAHDFKSDTTNIETLSADTLVFRFRDHLYRCSRQRETLKFHI